MGGNSSYAVTVYERACVTEIETMGVDGVFSGLWNTAFNSDWVKMIGALVLV